MTTKKPATPKPKANPTDRFDGYESADDDFFRPAGFWLPEAGPLHGKLVGGYQFIQKSGRGKGGTRTVYVFDLADPCIATLPGGERDQLAVRELCAVFASAGLRTLANLQGCFVRLERKPEKKELDNGNAMWLFDIRYRGKKAPVSIRPPLQAQDSTPDDFDPNDADLPF